MGDQMRSVIYCISAIILSTVFIGCGQSGVLHMPNDSNHDKRAKYLLYKNTAEQKPAQKPDSRPVKQEFATPATETNQP